MSHDPTTYLGAARHYRNGRPPYSPGLTALLTAELGLDGTGRLLDVGCGPGVLTVELAPMFEEAIGLDPDPDMLAEGRRASRARGLTTIGWVQGVAEDLGHLGLGRFRLVTFGQSFHWTDRDAVAELVFDLLEPGGAIALLAHTVPGRPAPASHPTYPPIPHDDIDALVARYLGPGRRAGQGYSTMPPDRYEDSLRRTRFGEPRILFAPGIPDLVRDTDSVVDGVFSMSWGAPHLFGDRRAEFESELRALLDDRSFDGRFWDWPGDTEIVIGRTPRPAP